MTTFGYIRVSTVKQGTKKNRHEILEFANKRELGKVHFVEEIVSGKAKWRTREIGSLIERMNNGDVLIVPELSRLGRSMLEIAEMLGVIADKGIRLFAIKNQWEFQDNMSSKILAMVHAIIAEVERDFISQRTKEGLAARKLAGVKLGRPVGSYSSKLDKHEGEIRRLLEHGSTITWVANRFQTTRANLYRWLKRQEWWAPKRGKK